MSNEITSAGPEGHVAILACATVSHIHQVLSMVRSARAHSRLDSYHLFICNAGAQTLATIAAALAEDFPELKVFGPDDLEASDRERFLHATAYFSAFEMSCLGKYVGLRHVLATTDADYCIFADGDLLVLGDLRETLAEIGEHTLLLTPHIIGPVNGVVEQGFLQHGLANGGYFCIRRNGETSARLLEWLIARISIRGFHAPHLALSCDQTWLSATAYIFNEVTTISRNPGINVAYWNVGERPVERAVDGGYSVRGRKLVFFHFSGFDPSNPASLSGYTDVPIARGSAVAELWDAYKVEMESVAGWKQMFASLPTIPFSQASMSERLIKGSLINNINLAALHLKQGFFTRLGQRVDLILGRRRQR